MANSYPLALLFVPHWFHSLLHWLSLHWGDVVPAWIGVILAGVFGWQSWRSSRRSRAAETDAREQADPRQEGRGGRGGGSRPVCCC